MSSSGGPPRHGPGDDSDDLSTGIIVCSVSCLCIATLAVSARFYTRTTIVRAVASEDWFALAALLLAIGSTAGTIWQARTGNGRHMWTLTPQDFMSNMKASWMTTLFYQLSLACCKISILLLYIRVLTYDYIRRLAYVLLAIVIIYNGLGFISTMTLCVPLQAFWDPSVHGNCHANLDYMWAVIGFHIGTDFLIFLLPIPVVLRMTLPASNKIMLLLIFALGFLVCLVSVLRAVWIQESMRSTDITWDNVSVTNWTSVEQCTSIVCACLIVIKPLVAKLWRRIRSSARSSGPGGAHEFSPSSESSSNGGRPPTIGTRATGPAVAAAMAQFDGHDDDSDYEPGGKKKSRGHKATESGIETALPVADQYAAALREVHVALPSPSHSNRSKEEISYC